MSEIPHHHWVDCFTKVLSFHEFLEQAFLFVLVIDEIKLESFDALGKKSIVSDHHKVGVTQCGQHHVV